VTAAAGIQHVYHNGEEANHFAILESLGGGVALFDFDGDGLLDIFLTGGGAYGGPDKTEITGLPSKLYRNLGGWKFQDVTAAVGLDRPLFYTHGAAVADYDRDGWPDLLVTGWGRLVLYHNEPDGRGGRRFVDVTQKAGLTDTLWSTSAAWGDLDGDGFPDLYVCHYTDWSFAKNPTCAYDGVTRDVCPPKQFAALPHILYRNNGDGTFTDVSKRAGLRVPREEADYAELGHLGPKAIRTLRDAAAAGEWGKGLGVLMVDVNDDRKPDIYVANDTVDKFLYLNRSTPGRILLEEVGLSAGVARDGNGSPNGSMGLDAADFDGCGRPSLWVTNYEGEMHALYRNECTEGREFFNYVTQPTGIVAIGQIYVGWGTQFVDLDHHGWQDLFISNGHAIRFPFGAAKRRQSPVLLRNLAHPSNPSRRKFVVHTAQGGPYFEADHCGRGVGFGDLDNDGRIDVVLNHLNEPAVVLRNEAPTAGRHWLGVDLRGKDGGSLVGAKVVLEAGGRKQSRWCKGGGSYLSTNDSRLTFGLGETGAVGRLTVYWPSGREQHWEGLGVDRYWRLTEGEKDAK
jgi:hypothetical protein